MSPAVRDSIGTCPAVRLILVEDEALALLDERRMLVQEGYEVIPFRRGEDAIETARNAEGIDMLITDVDLGPGLDGVEVAEAVVGTRPMPVLFITSSEETEIVRRIRSLRDYGFLKKGFAKAELLDAVEKALAEDAAKRSA